MKHLLLTLPALLASTATTFGQGAAPPAPVDPPELKLLDILSEGGIMMYPLALLSLIAVVLIFLFFPMQLGAPQVEGRVTW